jgi:hypothetical protein
MVSRIVGLVVPTRSTSIRTATAGTRVGAR